MALRIIRLSKSTILQYKIKIKLKNKNKIRFTEKKIIRLRERSQTNRQNEYTSYDSTYIKL